VNRHSVRVTDGSGLAVVQEGLLGSRVVPWLIRVVQTVGSINCLRILLLNCTAWFVRLKQLTAGSAILISC
jgi:hypothetical protein